MCGIVGVTLEEIGNVKEDLLNPLKRLEYRGYDSVGFALSNGIVEKDVGKIGSFVKSVEDYQFRNGIGHSRWATHGGITRSNSHPHTSMDKRIFAVHNGIIENSDEIRHILECEGYKFLSETDSEIIPHYIDSQMSKGKSINESIESFMNEIKGTYAVLVMFRGNNNIYAFKKDSPLVLTLTGDRAIVASDAHAFNNISSDAIFFDDYEYAIISPKDYTFFNRKGAVVSKKLIKVELEEEEEDNQYTWKMLKEINEQPKVATRLLKSLDGEQRESVDKMAEMIDCADRVVFIACGTSYHAALVGGSVLSKMGYDVHHVIASEFDTFYKVDDRTVIIAISQSGETMDVVTVIKEAKKKGALIGSIVNTPYSTVQRESEVSINIVAGTEGAVASTKAFTNQVLVLLEIANRLGANIDLNEIPKNIQKTIRTNDSTAKQVADDISSHEHVFFLGRGPSYPVAREMALKLKEISYIHAEGMMSGELKHGSIALIDPQTHTPVINLVSNNDPKMLSCKKEVEARGARVITVTNTENGDFTLPASNDIDFALYSVIIGQLLSYYTAVKLGRNVDQPRNLAKSVTVH